LYLDSNSEVMVSSSLIKNPEFEFNYENAALLNLLKKNFAVYYNSNWLKRSVSAVAAEHTTTKKQKLVSSCSYIAFVNQNNGSVLFTRFFFKRSFY
jgi:hypothetical protein